MCEDKHTLPPSSTGLILPVVTLRPTIPGFISEAVQKAKYQQFSPPKNMLNCVLVLFFPPSSLITFVMDLFMLARFFSLSSLAKNPKFNVGEKQQIPFRQLMLQLVCHCFLSVFSAAQHLDLISLSHHQVHNQSQVFSLQTKRDERMKRLRSCKRWWRRLKRLAWMLTCWWHFHQNRSTGRDFFMVKRQCVTAW